jgi:peroxiredoxin
VRVFPYLYVKNITETLGIGSRAPEFSLPLANSTKFQSLSEWTATGAVVLEFVRGTWCRSCRKRLPELQKLEPVLGQSGARLVCIAAEVRDGICKPQEYLKSHKITVPFLLDEDRSAIKAYGLFHRVGIDAWNIAHPATLVVDRYGRVRYIYKGSGQSDQAPIEDVLRAVRKLTM